MQFFRKKMGQPTFQALRKTAWWAGLLLAGIGLAQCEQTPGRMEGASLYRVHCANCHMENGEGLGALIPPLAKSDYLATHRQQLPCIVRHGLRDTIVVNGTVYTEAMAGISSLSDIQITNILNYIHTNWNNNLPPYRLDEVRQLLEQCP